MPNVNINIVVQPMLPFETCGEAGNARAQNKPHFRIF